jgi:hypothetical protein
MTSWISALALAAAPTGLRGSSDSVSAGQLDGRPLVGYETAVNTTPDITHILLIVFAIVAVIAVIALVAFLIANRPESRHSLHRRMQEDHAYLQSNLFNATSDILHETVKHSRR